MGHTHTHTYTYTGCITMSMLCSPQDVNYHALVLLHDTIVGFSLNMCKSKFHIHLHRLLAPCAHPKYSVYIHTYQTRSHLLAPDVTLSRPKISSSAARPPIHTSIDAFICLRLQLVSSLSGSCHKRTCISHTNV
jgi:hypothetical protein